jgi:hypothetical protein
MEGGEAAPTLRSSYSETTSSTSRRTAPGSMTGSTPRRRTSSRTSASMIETADTPNPHKPARTRPRRQAESSHSRAACTTPLSTGGAQPRNDDAICDSACAYEAPAWPSRPLIPDSASFSCRAPSCHCSHSALNCAEAWPAQSPPTRGAICPRRPACRRSRRTPERRWRRVRAAARASP